MAQIRFNVNNVPQQVDVDPQTPLLWVLRDQLNLNGTKFSCGIGECGACTVLIDGEAKRSCITPIDTVAGTQVTTIEGLSSDGDHRLQKAWLAENVSQCGYCQPGQILAATALLASNPHPSDEEIISAMSGVLCRCGTYLRILKAVQRVRSEGGL